jgi:hypothetical protein
LDVGHVFYLLNFYLIYVQNVHVSSFPLLTAAYKCTNNLYEGKQPSWYGSVKHILQNMPSLTNFLTDKTSTFKYKCNKIVKQHYLELWTKQAHSFRGKIKNLFKNKNQFWI